MRRFLRWLAVVVAGLGAALALGSLGTWYFWNDRGIGDSVSGWVSGSMRGAGGPRHEAFTIGRIHYPWIGATRSFLFGGDGPFEAWDIGIWDPDGHEVIFARHATGKIAVGWVAWTQILHLAIPGYPQHTEVHLSDVHIEHARALISAGGGPNAAVNIVAAFSGKDPTPGDPKNGVHLTADRVVLDDVEYTMDFPGWRAELNSARIRLDTLWFSSFASDQEGRDRPGFTFEVGEVSAPRGRLRLGEAFEFPLERFAASHFGSLPGERQHLGFAARVLARGAPTRITGRLEGAFGDHPGVDTTIGFEHGAGLTQLVPGGLLGGDPTGEVRIHGPFSHVLIDGHVEGAEFQVARLTAQELGARFALDGSKLALREVRSRLGRGQVGGAVDIDFDQLGWSAQLRSEGVDLSTLQPLVPRGTDALLGGSLEASASASGSFVVAPERIDVRGIDARLTRRGRGPLPQAITLRGHLVLDHDRLRLDGVDLAADGITASLRGDITPSRRTIRSSLRVEARGLGRLLERFGLPPVASALSALAQVSGPLLEPVLEGSVRATDVGLSDRRLPQVDARVHLEHGVLAARDLRSSGFGGTVEGEVSVGLWDGPFSRRLRQPTLHADVRARRLRVHTILDLPALRGEISGRFAIDGTLAHPTGSASLELPVLTIWGDPYHGGVFSGSLGEQGLQIDRLALERDGGGRFSGQGRVGWDGALDVEVQPRDFPVQAIPPLRDSPVALGGMLSGLVHLGGALGRWIPGGVIEATAIKVREFAFGDGRIDLKPEGTLVRLAGIFFSHFKFRVDGWITLVPSVAGDVTLAFEELPLDELIPEMKRLVEVQSVATGTARIRFDLLRSSADVELRLPRLAINFTSNLDEDTGNADEAAQQFENPPGQDIVVRWDGRSIQFDSFHLVDYEIVRGRPPRKVNDLVVAGKLSPDGCDASVRGGVELRFLEFLAGRIFEHTHGKAVADVRVLGPLARPHLLGSVKVVRSADPKDRVELVPRGGDIERAIVVPEGELEFREGSLVLRQLRAYLRDPAAGRGPGGEEQPAEIRADGALALSPEWQPGAVSLGLSGQVSAVPLSWLFPDHVSEAQGRFDVSLRVGGSFPTPSWEGAIRVRDVGFREKKLGRDLRVADGTLHLRGWDVLVGCASTGVAPGDQPPPGCRPVVARVEDAGRVNVEGLVGFQGQSILAPRIRLVSAHLTGENLDVGSTGVFSLQLSPDLVLSGSGEALKLTGAVNLVTGRYYQNFDILRDVILRPRTEETEPPFYAGIAALENMALEVNVVSSGALFIRDNVADLHVSLPSMEIGGTLARPVFDGTVFVEAGGRFTIPLLRGEFVSDPGSITFEADKDFPGRTPRLDIRASTDWQDRYDQIHHINLTVTGTYLEPYLDLSSTDGWDKNQVLAAMVTGGTPDQLRRAVTEPARGSGGGTSLSDGIVKSATGQLMKPIEDPLKQAIGLDLVRIELGYDSVLIKLCPVNKPTYRLCGTGDVGFVSTTRYDARAELKLTDHLSIGGALERIEHGVDTTEDVITRGKLQLSLRYPLY